MFDFYLYDTCSLYMVLLTFFVLYVSYFFAFSFIRVILDFMFFLLLLFCFFVFSFSNGFLLYVSYEASLLPIIYIIVKWGSYPERSLRALMLLLYTSVFSFPLIAGLFLLYSSSFSFYFTLFFPLYCPPLVLSLILFFSFSVKLPIYGLHYWLPIAHVEAPTFGSIILAGVLLKLGGVGLIRFLYFLDLSTLKTFLLSYFLVFLFFSSLLCCIQSDFKRLVAYSSVAHIIAVPLSLFSCCSISLKTALCLMLFHGISSPILFSLVGLIYSFSSSRQLVLVRGLLLISPLLSFVLVFSFLFTLSAPPYVSFFSEVLFFVVTLFSTTYSLPFLVGFALLCLVYNLNWLSSFLFNSVSYFHSNAVFAYSFALPIFLLHLASFFFLFLCCLI